jgi:hypothetical protein
VEAHTQCPECGTPLQDGKTCQDYFYQMLYWEAEFPEIGVVHHLMVLCYHLQHPSLYAPDGLEYSKGLLVDFVERNISTEESRRRSRDLVASDKRTFKIKGKPGLQGSYANPVQWTMTAASVTAAGADGYIDSVRKWAQTVLNDLRGSGNI